MTAFDIVFLAVLGLSMLVGVWRGFISECFAVAGWIAAFLLAWHFAPLVAPIFSGLSELPIAQWLGGFVAIFILSLVVLALLRFVLSRLIDAAGLAPTDRLLGAFFGALRGVLIALLLVLVGGATRLPQENWWREALFAPPLETAVIAAKPWLPQAVAERIRYR